MQGGHQLVFSSALVGQQYSNPIRGRYTVTGALGVLLKGSSLFGSVTEQRVIVIAPVSARITTTEGKDTMNTRKNILAATIGFFTGAGMVPGVMGQGVDASDSDMAFLLEEITVTATKRETNLQDTAMSISALGADTIEKRGLVGMGDYLSTIPGVSFQDRGAGQNSIVVRGVAASPQTENNVTGVYFGETPVAGLTSGGNGGGAGNADIKMVDIERVEVLRGPQGTLYGSGSMGGTVRIIPKAPDLQAFEGSVSARYSNTGENGGDNTMIQGVVNIPLIEDKLALRAVAYRFDNSGYIDNVAASTVVPGRQGDHQTRTLGFGGVARDRSDVGSDEYTGFRLSVRWQPIESLDVTLSYLTQEIEQLGWPEVNLLLEDYQQSRLQLRDGGYEGLQNDIEITGLTVNYDFGWGVVTSASSLVDYSAHARFDDSFFQGYTLDTHNSTDVDFFVEELRFSSDFDGPLQLVAGIYYEEIDSERFADNGEGAYYGDPAREEDAKALLFGLPFGSPFIPEGPLEFLQFGNGSRSQTAFFGELSYQLTERFVATVGARRFKYEEEGEAHLTGIFGDFDAFADFEDSGDTFKTNLSYHVSDDTLLYAQWAQGFRMGSEGNTPPGGCDPDGDRVVETADGRFIKVGDLDPDETDNFELGLKTSFSDNRITLNASVYRINWTGIPVLVALDCGAATKVNAGESTSEGIEIESQLLLSDSLRLDVSLSHNEAKLTEDAVLSLGPSAVKGADLPGSADFNASIGLEYGFQLADSDAFVRLDYSYVGEYFSSFEEGANGNQASGDYHQFNLKTGVDFDKTSIDFFVNNLTNENAYSWVEASFSQNGFSRAYQLRPRTLGMNLRYQF